MIPEAHLSPSPLSKRALAAGRAFPLIEPDMPEHDPTPASLITVVKWLSVETSARYQPKDGQTFCNIYACDYCYLNGVYLPRVWWTKEALVKINAGLQVPIKYGGTVLELNANSLYWWLVEHSASFGWKKTDSLFELQSAANRGCVAVICADRTDPKRAGHISCVVPEQPPSLIALVRRSKIPGAGIEMVLPMQSQAGMKNFCFSCGSDWWAGPQFKAHGFWYHE